MKRIFEVMTKRKERKLREQQEGNNGQTEEGEDWEEVHAATAEAAEEDGTEDLRVDQYMVVFVKFLAGVMPGVEMDYTMGM